MNSQKLILAAIWIAACTNVTAQTQDNSNTQPSAIADKVTLLQSARQAGLPSSIEPKGTIHLSIRKLGDARVSTQQVANELIEWLFVREERVYSTEKFSLIDIHPAAQSLIAIGTDAIAPLKNKLATTASNDDAVLILRCLQHIYQTNYAAQLQQIKSQTNSDVVKQAVDFVLSEPRETTPTQTKLEPEN